jgi:hypothetical protein
VFCCLRPCHVRSPRLRVYDIDRGILRCCSCCLACCTYNSPYFALQVAPPYEDLLVDYGVKYKQQTVKGITSYEVGREDGAGGVVGFQDGTEQPFDRLIVALGGVINMSALPALFRFKSSLAFQPV